MHVESEAPPRYGRHLHSMIDRVKQQAWRPTNAWHRLYTDTKHRYGKSNPAKAAVARKVLIAASQVLALHEPFKASAAAAARAA